MQIYTFIPSACEVKEKLELVTDNLQTVVIACQQARKGGGDEIPFGVQCAEAFVVVISAVLQGESIDTIDEGVACLGYSFGAVGADKFRCQRR